MRKAFLLVLIIFSGNALAIDSMKMPVDGVCDDHYWPIEGVCVHVTAMQGDAKKMKVAIEEYKKSGKAPVSVKSPKVKPKKQSRCERYKERLKKYETEGVMGINPATGKLQQMTGEDAKWEMENTRQNVELFCDS